MTCHGNSVMFTVEPPTMYMYLAFDFLKTPHCRTLICELTMDLIKK